MLEAPPIDPRALDLRWGEVTCSATSTCSIETYDLVLTAWVSGFPGAIGFEVPVSEGPPQTIEDNGTTFELVRSTIESCPDELRARTASWAAWRSR
jgi:hypothetical protein